MFLGFLQILLEPGNIFFFFSDAELILVGGGRDVEIYNITTGGLSLPHYYLTLFLVAWLQIWLPNIKTVVLSLLFTGKNLQKIVIHHKSLVFNLKKAIFLSMMSYLLIFKMLEIMHIFLGLSVDVFGTACS